MTLTKADLVQKVYKNHDNLTKAQATEAVEALLSSMKNCLSNGEDLLISGFGKFSVTDNGPGIEEKFNVKDKNARRGRNPQTGEELILEPRRVITFKPSGILRTKIND